MIVKMTDSAQIMSRLRASFATTKGFNLKPAASVNTTQGKLDVLDKILTEIEQNALSSTNATDATDATSAGAIAQAIPQVTLAATDTLNPAQVNASLKESEAAVSPDIGPVESGAGLQQVEHEPSPELSPEVENYLQKAELNQDQSLSEVVIADGTTTPSTAYPPMKKPVIVLPITAEEEKEGQKKSLRLSIRWLVEWSKKIMKMFAGEVIYKQEPITQ